MYLLRLQVSPACGTLFLGLDSLPQADFTKNMPATNISIDGAPELHYRDKSIPIADCAKQESNTDNERKEEIF